MASAGAVVHKIIALVVFAATVVFVLRPVKIPIPFARHRKFPVNLATAPVLGVVVLLATLTLSPANLLKSFIGDSRVQPWTLLIIFNLVAYVSLSLELTGLFKFIALVCCRSINRGIVMFVAVYGLSACISILASNDIVILVLTPIVVYLCKILGIEPKPYVFGSFLAANIFGICIYVGNPTNIIAYNLGFIQFSAWMAVPGLLSGAACLGISILYFWKDIYVDLPSTPDFDSRGVIKSRFYLIFGCLLFSGMLVSLVCSTWIAKWVPIWMILLIFGVASFLFDLHKDIRFRLLHPGTPLWRARAPLAAPVEQPGCRSVEALSPSGAQLPSGLEALLEDDLPSDYVTVSVLSRVPWATIPFVVGMFAMVKALDQSGWIQLFAQWLGYLSGRMGTCGSIYLFGFLTAFVCAVINNQPAVILLSSILINSAFHLRVTAKGEYASAFATIAGANWGGNITLIGALAGLLWLRVLNSKNIHYSYWEFSRVTLLIMPIPMAVGCASLCLESAVYPLSLYHKF